MGTPFTSPKYLTPTLVEMRKLRFFDATKVIDGSARPNARVGGSKMGTTAIACLTRLMRGMADMAKAFNIVLARRVCQFTTQIGALASSKMLCSIGIMLNVKASLSTGATGAGGRHGCTQLGSVQCSGGGSCIDSSPLFFSSLFSFLLLLGCSNSQQ